MQLYLHLLDSTLIEFYSGDRSNYNSDSGFDLFFKEDFEMKAGETRLVGLGVAASAYEEYISSYGSENRNIAFWLIPRSSISKTRLRMSNSVGLIDSSYRGELMVSLDALGDCSVKRGDRLFQICSYDLKPIKMNIVNSLDRTERGSGGFGSTN